MLTIFLLGCPYLDNASYTDVLDADGDRLLPIHLDGRDCDDQDPDVGDCDADRDGFRSVLVGGTDCDDANATVHPEAPERCDGIDNDCDQRIDDADDAPLDTRSFWNDGDGDGYGAGPVLARCEPLDGQVPLDGDCDDTAASMNPGAAEQCDGVDWNCDGDPQAGAGRSWFHDGDGDGFGDPDQLVGQECARPSNDAASNPFDCDDTDPLAHPADTTTGLDDEVCDGIDNDCDGLVDGDDSVNDPAAIQAFVDADGDGFGDALTSRLVCPHDLLDGDLLVANALDCDDDDPIARPGPGPAFATTEVCDGFDNDCDGLVDVLDPSLDESTAVFGYPDDDGDGFGANVEPRPYCGAAATVSGDCDDDDPGVNPEQTERCDFGLPSGADAVDEDCDGLFGSNDPDNDGTVAGFIDADGDGRGADLEYRPLCRDDLVPPGLSTAGGDCNDADGTIWDPVPWYLDGDGDGYGLTADALFACFPAVGRAPLPEDCDDGDSAVHPGAIEYCGNGDENCDQQGDLGAVGSILGFEDHDRDGFGDGELGFYCRTATTDVVPEGGDCNDLVPDIHPGRSEACACDLAAPTGSSGACPVYCPEDAQDSTEPCIPLPAGECTQLDGTSCALDFNCDGLLEQDDPTLSPTVWHLDADLDGFGNPDVLLAQCDQPVGYIGEGTDCDDDDARAYFTTYFGSDAVRGDAQGRVFDELSDVITNPGRCRGTASTSGTTVILLDPQVTFFVEDDFALEADMTVHLQPPEGPDPAIVCWSPTAQATLSGRLLLEDAVLQFGVRSADGQSCELAANVPTPPFLLTGAGTSNDLASWNAVDLRNVVLQAPTNGFAAPLVTSTAPSDRFARVLFEGVGFDGMRLDQGLVDLGDIRGSVQLSQVTLDGITSGTSLLRVGPGHSPGQTRLENVALTGGSIDGALVEHVDRPHAGAPSVETRFLEVTGTTFNSPLFCVGTGGCGAPGAVSPLVGAGIRFNSTFIDSVDAPLAVVTHTASVTTEGLTVSDGGTSGTEPWLQLTDGTWTSRRDRLDGDLDVAGGGALFTLTSTHVTGSLTITDPTGIVDATGVSVAGAGSEVTLAVDSAELQGLVLTDGADLVTGSTTLTTRTALDTTHHAVYRRNSSEPGLCAAGPPDFCGEFHPTGLTAGFVSYTAGQLAERQIPFPFEPYPSATDPDHALFWDVTATPWNLDPNQDGLPVAWLQFFATTPDCWDQPSLFLAPSTDIDGDGLSNLAEIPLGTWPCLADTDEDFIPDGDDPDPLLP